MSDAMRDATTSAPLRRRDFVKVVGLGAAAIGLGAGPPGSAAAATRLPHPLVTHNVNLYCTVKPVIVDTSGVGKVMITCGNFGPDDATSSVSLKYVTPFYLNVPTLPTVSGATVAWLYQNTAVDVPSLIQVTWSSGIAAGATKSVEIDANLDSGCPDQAPDGRAIFTTDAGNTVDIDSDLTRNAPFGRIRRRPLSTSPTPGNANLLWSYKSLPLVAGGSAVNVPFSFYNLSGSLLGTLHTSHFTFVTPFYCDVPSSGRPGGLSALYENTADPAIPSIYRLNVPAGLGFILGLLNNPLTINIPFQAVTGEPVGHLKGNGIFVPTGSDTQGDFSNAYHPYGLMSVVSGAV